MRIHLLTSVAMLAFALPAQAREAAQGPYGSAGQLEAGGSFGFASVKDELKDANTSSSGTVIQVRPQVGYFAADGLELIGTFDVVNSSGTEEDPLLGSVDVTNATIGLGFGGGYFFGGKGARLGPQLLLFLTNDTFTADLGPTDYELKAERMGAEASMQAKVALGGGGVITAGIGAQFANIKESAELGALSGDSDGTGYAIRTSVGFLVYF